MRPDQTGICFTGIDEEGFFHLKRLVQFNARDPDRIDRELASGFHQDKK